MRAVLMSRDAEPLAAAPQGASATEQVILQVALGLHQAGAPAHRLESVVSAVAHHLGVEARIFSTPTAVYAGFGPPEAMRTTLLRAEPGRLDLSRLDALDDIVRRLLAGELEPAPALLDVAALAGRPARWGTLAVLPALGLTAAAASVLFGGGVEDVLGAAVVGTAMGGVSLVIGGRARLAPLADLLSALTASLLAGLWTHFVVPADAGLITLASIIALLPGLSLTTAITELASGHLVSGTARLAGVGTTLASLAMGALAGAALLGAAPPAHVTSLPPGAELIALGVAVTTFTVLLQARMRDAHVIALASITGFLVARLVGAWVSAPFDAAMGALAVGLVANATARLRDRPAAVPLIPGLFLLVPGSVGFRGLVQIYGADVTGGVDGAVRALITAAALAAGILVANMVLPPKRPL